MGGIIVPRSQDRLCIYCRKAVGHIGIGEHVIPRSIGGKKCLNCVCSRCNSSFSDVEKELISRSPMAILVQQVFGTRGSLIFGYDPAIDIALEARPLLGFKGPPLWPQLVFMGEKTLFAFDHDEANRVSIPTYAKVFKQCMEAALISTIEKPKRPHWIWEQVRCAPNRGRYPPRVFTEHTSDEFNRDITFKCRYTGTIEKGWIFHLAREWYPNDRYKLDVRFGSPDLQFNLVYRWEWVLRALTKIGINLLVLTADPEAVNHDRFGKAMDYISGKQAYRLSPATDGFVYHDDIQPLACPVDCHRFWMLHDGQNWHCDYAFFGGQLGAHISFPGPSVGPWRGAEITAPYKTNDKWEVNKFSVRIPRRVRVEWVDIMRLLPSVPQRKIQ